MNTYKWDAIQRSLIVTQNPILFSDDFEYEQAIINTGYAPEMSSFEQCGEGGVFGFTGLQNPIYRSST
jgi:hypothetical protein